MRRADYRCQCGYHIDCQYEQEMVFDFTPPASVRSECPGCHCETTLYRVWGPMHTGRGSSGEPPR